MSSWGKLDAKRLTGNIRVVNGSATVTNATNNVSFISSEIRAGDYFVVGGVTGNLSANGKYYVSLVSGNVATLSTPYTGATGNFATANVQQGPKYVTNVSNTSYGTANGNTYTIQKIYGIDSLESGVQGNKANGITHTGWVHQVRYTDAYGALRKKSEVLVAMSKNFNRDNTNTSNTLIQYSGNLLIDAEDDAIVRDAQ
jgi:hypothetical protein